MIGSALRALAIGRAIPAWLREHGLDRISGQERHKALKVLDNIDAIHKWRAGPR